MPAGQPTEVTWRDALTARLLRGFALVTALTCVPFAFVVHGLHGAVGIAISLLCAAGLWRAAARPKPGRRNGLLLVGATLLGALVGYATVGFFSGPAVALSMAVTLAGLLLGTRWMMGVLAFGGAAMLTIGALMSRGILPVPLAADVALTDFRPWLRTTLISVILLAMFVRVIVQVVEQLESALQRARSETEARKAAEQAQRETEHKALEAQKLETMGRLAAGIAHDFNNNLTVIIGLSELVRSELEPNDPRREMVDEILDASTRSAEFTRQLLAVSRKAQPRTAPLDLQSVVEGAVKLFRRSAPSSIRVETQWSAPNTQVSLDHALTQNALLNLMLNAKDAMREGGTLRVRTSVGRPLPGAPELASIEIEDTGTGISADVLPRIFEPFFTTKDVGEGTGLGLASVAATIRGHGGEIDVETEVGKGTLFRITLPCAAATVTQEHTAAAAASGAHILVIDEDASVRAAAKANLSALGYKVTLAPGDGEALELLKQKPAGFDLAILDVRGQSLNEHGGFDALRKQVPALRVLLWSGYRGNQDVADLIQRGAVGFLDKPYLPTELGAAVARALAPGRQSELRPAHAE
jgi:signal transduction histidine kinase/ActR/RegA family two-component response regulator